jgi:peptidoglycan/xylan/chitin deacetylase (PgdA/CDA1 family)
MSKTSWAFGIRQANNLSRNPSIFALCCAFLVFGSVITACDNKENPLSPEQLSSSVLSSSTALSSQDPMSSAADSTDSTALSSSSFVSSATSSSSQSLKPISVAGSPVYTLPQDEAAQNIDSSNWKRPLTEASLAPYEGFRRSAMSLTFDDGFATHRTVVAPILDKYGLKASFYVITSKLSSGTWRFGSWEDFEYLASQGHEVGDHTTNHATLTTPGIDLQKELDASLAMIRQKIPSQKGPISMAYPNTMWDKATAAQIEKRYIAGRIGMSTGKYPASMSAMPGLLIQYNGTRDASTELKAIDGFKDGLWTNLVSKGKWSTHIMHEVVSRDSLDATGSYHPVASDVFDSYCAWLSQMQKEGYIWIAPIREVAKYQMSRGRTRIGVLSESPDQWVLAIDDGLADSDYNRKMGIEIPLPANWTAAKVRQGNQDLPSTVVEGKLRFELIPSAQTVTLSKN